MPKLLITGPDVNILRVSCFLRNTPELNDVYKLVVNNNRIDEKLVINQKRRHEIQRRINSWLRVSLEEWKVDKTRSPHDLTSEERENQSYRCAFCHAKLTATAYYVVNRIDGKSIVLGTDCVNKLSDPEFMENSHVNQNSEQQIRYEHLIVKYPQVEMIMNAGRNRVNTVKFVVSRRLNNDFEDVYKLVNSSVSAYKRTGKFIGKARELSQNLSKYKDIWRRIQEFQDKAEKDTMGCYLDHNIILNEKRLDKRKVDEIIEDVQKNGGKVNTAIAAKIRNFPFLEKISIIYQNNPYLTLFNIQAVDNGRMHLILSIQNKRYGFYLSSYQLIHYFKFPSDTKKRFEMTDIVRSLGDILEPDYEAKGRLMLDFEKVLESKKIHKFLVSADRIWKKANDQQKSWLSEQYRNRHFFIGGKDRIIELNREGMVKLSKNILFNIQGNSVQSQNLKDVLVGNFTEETLYKKIRDSFDISSTFN